MERVKLFVDQLIQLIRCYRPLLTGATRKVWDWVSSTQQRLIIASVIVVIIIATPFAWRFLQSWFPDEPLVTWTMIDVSGRTTPGDAHLIEFTNGRRILIDTARRSNAKRYLLPFLRQKGVTSLDRVILTNPLLSKTGGMDRLLASGIDVGAISFNRLTADFCEARAFADCDLEKIDKIVDGWGRQVRIWPMAEGQKLIESDDVILEVVFVHNGLFADASRARFQNATTILSLSVGNNRILFASDIGDRHTAALVPKLQNTDSITLIKVPYWGLHKDSDDAFVSLLRPSLKGIFSPGTLNHWTSERKNPTEQLFQDVPVYISGRDGNIEVKLYGDRFEVNNYPNEFN